MPTIMIVDDDKSLFQVMQNALAPMNVDLVCFDNANDALDYLHQQSVTLVLMDLLLPSGMAGWDAIQIIKDDPTLYHIPVIAFTAGSSKHIKQALQNGADNFIQKPFALSQLRQIVSQYLGAKQQ